MNAIIDVLVSVVVFVFLRILWNYCVKYYYGAKNAREGQGKGYHLTKLNAIRCARLISWLFHYYYYYDSILFLITININCT